MKYPRLYIALILFVVGLAGIVFSRSRFNSLPRIIDQIISPEDRVAFPIIESDKLTQNQQKIIAELKNEYAINPKGSKYSEGVEEPWCADFVSWVYKEAGMPLVNPNSGSWRIPGVLTLKAYYQSIGRYKPANSEYFPKIGDAILYDNPSLFGQHVNFVIKIDHGSVTTVGGNEPGGIRIFTRKMADKAGLIGYGILR